MGRSILVVSTVDHAESELRKRLGDDVEAVKVVVPVVRQGFLDWLAMDERAFSHAEEEAERLAEELPGAVTEARAGDADVLLAIQDALATFPADEIVVALGPDHADELDETRTIEGVPVRVLVTSDNG